MKLTKGNIYFQTYRDGSATYITRYTGTFSDEKFIHIQDRAFRKEGCSDLEGLTSREATEDEIIWYEACEKAKKYVSKTKALSDVQSLYPIY